MLLSRRRWPAAALSVQLAILPLAGQTAFLGSRPFPTAESLTYSIEWRLITAGNARLTLERSGAGWQSGLQLESTGLVSKLYKVDDRFTAHYERAFCIVNSTLNANEGKRKRDTHVTYDSRREKASYLERDLIKNAIIRQSEIDVPSCVHDVFGALYYLRTQTVEPGHSIEIPMSDGRKFVPVRVEAQEREDVKIDKQTYKTVRYEAMLFNRVLYARGGRLFVWLTEDASRLPVKLQIRTGFPIGTVTLQLEKHEQS
jgi:hypothetical protein